MRYEKPFDEYKWRWATLTPTESLNRPPILLGVLRAMYANIGLRPSSAQFNIDLRRVQNETNSTVDLVRTEDRNIIRNSGQYWKIFGLLDDTERGQIQLTQLGRAVAEARISQSEFVFKVIQDLELPNPYIEDDTLITIWNNAGLRIKPLKIILEIIFNLRNIEPIQAFITPNELAQYVIPMVGAKSDANQISQTLLSIRNGTNTDFFSDCCPEANDKRMAREFILFLEYHGVLVAKGNYDRFNVQYYAEDFSVEDLGQIIEVDEPLANPILNVVIPDFERRKVQREIIERPYQARFRKAVLNAFDARCFITGTNIPSVLEAAHIVPVSENGNDSVENSLCLRKDIHALFDCGHIRITRDGEIKMPDNYRLPANYSYIPERVIIPEFTNIDFLDWRIKYL